MAPQVLGRYVFYNNSAFDGRSAAPDARDDAAIATNKQALLPGQVASFANYTSYGRGINGVMIDVGNGGAPVTADNFTFRVGNSSNSSAWAAAPLPTAVARRAGAGVSGSDRVTITWLDRSIRNKWLQVSFRAAAGQAPLDVFYFGNAVGETGDSATNAAVSAVDVATTRANLGVRSTGTTSRWDFDRDGRVSVLDLPGKPGPRGRRAGAHHAGGGIGGLLRVIKTISRRHSARQFPASPCRSSGTG